MSYMYVHLTPINQPELTGKHDISWVFLKTCQNSCKN